MTKLEQIDYLIAYLKKKGNQAEIKKVEGSTESYIVIEPNTIRPLEMQINNSYFKTKNALFNGFKEVKDKLRKLEGKFEESGNETLEEYMKNKGYGENIINITKGQIKVDDFVKLYGWKGRDTRYVIQFALNTVLAWIGEDIMYSYLSKKYSCNKTGVDKNRQFSDSKKVKDESDLIYTDNNGCKVLVDISVCYEGTVKKKNKVAFRQSKFNNLVKKMRNNKNERIEIWIVDLENDQIYVQKFDKENLRYKPEDYNKKLSYYGGAHGTEFEFCPYKVININWNDRKFSIKQENKNIAA